MLPFNYELYSRRFRPVVEDDDGLSGAIVEDAPIDGVSPYTHTVEHPMIFHIQFKNKGARTCLRIGQDHEVDTIIDEAITIIID